MAWLGGWIVGRVSCVGRQLRMAMIKLMDYNLKFVPSCAVQFGKIVN